MASVGVYRTRSRRSDRRLRRARIVYRGGAGHDQSRSARRGAAVYASQAYAEARGRRLRRIERRAIAELQAAYNEGRLSLRAYEGLSKLSAHRQRKAIKSDRNKEQAQNLAAAAIRSVLANKPCAIDLGLIAAAITASIRSP